MSPGQIFMVPDSGSYQEPIYAIDEGNKLKLWLNFGNQIH